MKKCPYCAEEIQEEAIKCRFCGRDLAGQPPTDNKWQLFAERFKAADPATQRRLWADLTEDQRRYLQTNFRLSGSSVQSPARERTDSAGISNSCSRRRPGIRRLSLLGV